MTDAETKRDLLKSLMKAKRLSPEALCSYLRKQKTLNLSPANLHRLLKRGASSKNNELLDILTACLVELPDAPKVSSKGSRKGHIAITPAMRAELNGLLEQTGFKPSMIAKNAPPDIDTLTANKISNWRRGRTGHANRNEWEYVLSVLRRHVGIRSE